MEDISPFTSESLEPSIKSLQLGKATDLNGIPCEGLKSIFEINTGLLLSMPNTSLLDGIFPTQWKVARFVLVSKGKGSSE